MTQNLDLDLTLNIRNVVQQHQSVAFSHLQECRHRETGNYHWLKLRVRIGQWEAFDQFFLATELRCLSVEKKQNKTKKKKKKQKNADCVLPKISYLCKKKTTTTTANGVLL